MSFNLMKRAMRVPTGKGGRLLSSSEKWLLVAMADFADEQGYCWPSGGTLAKVTGFSRPGLMKMISALEEKSYLRRMASIGKSNDYVLTASKWPQEEPSGQQRRRGAMAIDEPDGGASAEVGQLDDEALWSGPKSAAVSPEEGAGCQLGRQADEADGCQPELHGMSSSVTGGVNVDDKGCHSRLHDVSSSVTQINHRTSQGENQSFNQERDQCATHACASACESGTVSIQDSAAGEVGAASPMQIMPDPNDWGPESTEHSGVEQAPAASAATEAPSTDLSVGISRRKGGGASPAGDRDPATIDLFADLLPPEPTAEREKVKGTKTQAKSRSTSAGKINFNCWPEEPSPDAWEQYAEMRKKKSPITQRGANMIGNQIARIIDVYDATVDDVLDVMMMQGWRGVQLSWVDRFFERRPLVPEASSAATTPVEIAPGVTVESTRSSQQNPAQPGSRQVRWRPNRSGRSIPPEDMAKCREDNNQAIANYMAGRNKQSGS